MSERKHINIQELVDEKNGDEIIALVDMNHRLLSMYDLINEVLDEIQSIETDDDGGMTWPEHKKDISKVKKTIRNIMEGKA